MERLATRIPKSSWTLIVILLFVMFFFFDWTSGSVMSVALFYMVPIALASWTLGMLPAAAIAILSEASWILIRSVQSPVIHYGWVFYWNSIVRLCIYLSFAILLSSLKDLLKVLTEREELVRKIAARVIRAQEEERMRISRELHDHASQDLAALTFGLEELNESVRLNTMEACAPFLGEAVETISDLKRLAKGAIQNLRGLALNLRPKLLDDLGLQGALSWLCREQLDRSGVRAEFISCPECGRLPEVVELAFFRVAQEACANILKHSKAQSAMVRLSKVQDAVCLEFLDDGVGFAQPQRRRQDDECLGILGMRERISLLGGDLEVYSTPGKGTHLCALIPTVVQWENNAGAAHDSNRAG